MASFTYSARRKNGERVEGSITAPDRRVAASQLRAQGLMPIQVNESGKTAAPKKTATKPPAKKKAAPSKPSQKAAASREINIFNRKGGGRAPRMKLREALEFTRELGDLISSGMTLGSALSALSRRQNNPGQGEIITQLRDNIIQGESLSDAMAKHPATFTPFFVNMVRAGEAAGQLPDALQNVTQHYERVLEAREKVQSAMVYPIFLLIAGIATIIFIIVKIIPNFASVFDDLGSTMPLPTRMLIGLSGFMQQYGLLLFGVIAALVFVFMQWKKTDAGRLIWHGLLLRMPIISRVVKANAFLHFSRTLGGLLHNGVPVLQALNIVELTMDNRVIAAEIASARERVTDGSSISGPLAEGEIFPPLLTDMLRVGEDTGDVSKSLGHIARRYETDLERSIKFLTTMIEPLLLIVLGGFIGFIAISMMLAVFDISAGLDM